ncbi:hypothetical protein [Actinokineospora cianjurensis]|uniref:Uncharacterized protein n=1 Tax=Actinokineospora cianjurensis TaxID=585224 RepID=A0A421AXD4_9PSEU|nr:hypothetical protein [Actinokineospora cianjurensis]RLK54451.1 hypothetical protein CLV68_6003 [Actinokineospora cianjurensis]
MTSRLELDLPAGNDTLPFTDLAGFVDHVRAAGANADTPVVAVAAEQDESILIALRVELDGLAARPATIAVDRADIKDLLTEIDDNDGDTRSHQQTVRELRQRLTGLALGS